MSTNDPERPDPQATRESDAPAPPGGTDLDARDVAPSPGPDREPGPPDAPDAADPGSAPAPRPDSEPGPAASTEPADDAGPTATRAPAPEATPEPAPAPDAEAAPRPAPEPEPDLEAATGVVPAPAPPPSPLPDVIPGAKWGWVDEEGNVRQRDGVRHRGRAIGKLAGRSRYSVFQFFVDRFAKLDHHADVLERELRASPNKGRFSERVSRLLDRIRKADALGDFDTLIDRVERMLAEIETYQAEQAEKKEDLCRRAAELASSTNWKATTDAMKTLQQEWKTLGSTTRARDDELWGRFRGAMDEFFKRRDEDRAKKRIDREAGSQIKRELCERAEALRESTDWKKTADEQSALMDAWKAAPWAGKPEEDRLWKRFREARSAFFARRAADRKERQHSLADNRQRKDALCEAAEALLASEDHYAACEQVKQLQAEWKNVGPVPRSVSEKQWTRFRSACNAVFSKARAARGEEKSRARGRERRPRRGAPRQPAARTHDRTEGLRESIARDQEALDRWRQTLDRMKGGGSMREALEAKVGEIAARVDADRARLEEMEQAARARRESESKPAARPSGGGTKEPPSASTADSGS